MTVHHLKSKCGGGGGAMRGKIALLLGFLLCFILAFPVQSQTCGLPTSAANWTSSTAQTTWNMTADCTPSVTSGNFYLRIQSGAFTINGNGYSIIGPGGGKFTIRVNSGATLNLNNVIIRQGGGSFQRAAVYVLGHLIATDVTLRNNTAKVAMEVLGSSARADLTNVRFLNNTAATGSSIPASALRINISSTVNLRNAYVTGNTGGTYVIMVLGSATLNVRGCLTFGGNTGINLAVHGGQGTINNNSIGACVGGGFATVTPTPRPRKKEKESQPPTPTSTPRPAYAASYIALQTETGMTFEAAYGLDSGVHFRQLDGAGIGIQSIIDAGPLAALDVYGYVEQGVEVCFPQIGRVVFLDARTMPRAITTLPATVRDGMTCVYLDSPGSLVLLPN